MNKIDSFKGKYFFLSNFYTANVTFEGLTYLNNEAAFQAQKCIKSEMKERFCSMDPSRAKHRGRSVQLRPDWEKVKESYMYQIVKAKFTQNDDLRNKLIETGDMYLEEGNDWGDKTWGTVKGVGRNLLGKILMKVRDELKQ